MYILGAAKPEPYIDTKFLESHGAPPGSIYTCNPAAYMTDKTWDDNVEDFSLAIRRMDPVITTNPNWWVEWHVDGFKSKVSTLKGQAVMLKHKIAVVQSFSHSSHINQVCALSHVFAHV